MTTGPVDCGAYFFLARAALRYRASRTDFHNWPRRLRGLFLSGAGGATIPALPEYFVFLQTGPFGGHFLGVLLQCTSATPGPADILCPSLSF
jgi:hypothetical protein